MCVIMTQKKCCAKQKKKAGVNMDMEQKRARHRRFWQPLQKGEGAYLSVVAPVSDGQPPYHLRKAESVEENWLSTQYRLEKAEARMQNTYFGQDAIQCEFVNFGPGVQAALLGAPYAITKDSIWFDRQPPIKDWEHPVVFKTDPEHPLYHAIAEHTRALCEHSKGRYAVSFTDIGGQLDVLYSMRGEELLMDLLEYPDEVLAAEAQIDREFIEYFNTLQKMIGPTGCGYTNWIPLVHDKPWYPLQCDMSVMISPAMFEEFVLPSLAKVAASIGQAVYHLDGPGEIKHLDMILSLPEVHAVQWVPLPNTKDQNGRFYQDFADKESIDVYRKTLAAGKKVVLLGVRPNQISAIFDAVGCDGVFIETYPGSRSRADELIDFAAKEWIR